MIRPTRGLCGLMVWQHWVNLKEQGRPLRWIWNDHRWGSLWSLWWVCLFGRCSLTIHAERLITAKLMMIFVMFILWSWILSLEEWGLKEAAATCIKVLGFSWLQFWLWEPFVSFYCQPQARVACCCGEHLETSHLVTLSIACFFQHLMPLNKNTWTYCDSIGSQWQAAYKMCVIMGT